jgi:hypothetical protein
LTAFTTRTSDIGRRTCKESNTSAAPTAQEILVDYLGVSERQLGRALQHLVTDGKYELAASLLESFGGRFAHSESVAKTERLVYLKLMEQYQNTDPFKFLLYSGQGQGANGADGSRKVGNV